MTPDNIKERIRKIATLAAKAGTDGEAQAAALALQRLLDKHGLEISDLEEVGPEKHVEHVVADEIKSYTIAWKGWLAQVICDNFRCEAYWQKGRGKYDAQGEHRYINRLHFMGLSHDVYLAKEAYVMTAMAMQRLAKKHLRERKRAAGHSLGVAEAMAIRHAYLKGFVDGLRDAFKEQVKSTDIVLMRDAMLEDAITAMHFTHNRGSSKADYWDGEAQAAGRRDGAEHARASRRGKVGGGERALES